ncbi:hypothetical protein BAC3_01378 [uncultured bacterium]|nr:hypothetical protein BAC3_01378 [uncultured bacterium]
MTITTEMIEQVVDSLGDSFDSHKVFLELAHKNQRAYVEALQCTDSDTPFNTLHLSLGKLVKEVCIARGFVEGTSYSNDIFLHKSKCASWSRTQ